MEGTTVVSSTDYCRRNRRWVDLHVAIIDVPFTIAVADGLNLIVMFAVLSACASTFKIMRLQFATWPTGQKPRVIRRWLRTKMRNCVVNWHPMRVPLTVRCSNSNDLETRDVGGTTWDEVTQECDGWTLIGMTICVRMRKWLGIG